MSPRRATPRPPAPRALRPVVLAVFGDLHGGSTLAPCPPEGIELPDGGTYLPNPVQRWQWDCWQDFWQQIGAERDRLGAELGILSNGDLVDGPGHHKTHQSISPNTADAQALVTARLLDVPQALRPDWWVFTVGTSSHVGNGGDGESGFARRVGAARHPVTGGWVWHTWTAEIHGVRIDARHHGRTGGRPWTSLSALGNLATEILVRHAEEGRPAPHLALRSHKHTPGDTGDHHRVRLLALPAWQCMTDFAFKVVPEAAVNQIIGGIAIVIHPGGAYEVKKHFYRPSPDPVWTPA